MHVASLVQRAFSPLAQRFELRLPERALLARFEVDEHGAAPECGGGQADSSSGQPEPPVGSSRSIPRLMPPRLATSRGSSPPLSFAKLC